MPEKIEKNKGISLEKEYGIVLEGGGAKGAYQIGVWKAFLECGVKIKGVAGVSVGALNGALIAMGNYEEAEELWRGLTFSSVMDVDDEKMGNLLGGKLKDLKLVDLTKDLVKIIRDRGIGITPLKDLIDTWVDEEKICNSDIEFYLGTFSLNELKGIEISAKEADKAYLKDYLLASAYLPAFRNEKLHGKTYLDGGLLNNVPTDMLISRDYKDIIVIRIHGPGFVKPIVIPKDVNVIEINSKVDLGGILEFDNRKIRRNISIGYLDGMSLVKGFLGRKYYLDWKKTEEEAFQFFYHVNEHVKMALLEYFKYDYGNKDLDNRLFIEVICPSIAKRLRLDKNWTYTDLLLACAELGAMAIKVPRYTIYTDNEFLKIISEKYETIEDDTISLFPLLLLKMLTI